MDVVYPEEKPPVRFADITFASGLSVNYPFRSASLGDFDGNGWLDLLVAGQLFINENGSRLMANVAYLIAVV